MKLIITDHGDESVGLFPTSYVIEAPVSLNDDKDLIEEFKQRAIDLYSEFVFDKVSAIYGFEIAIIEAALQPGQGCDKACGPSDYYEGGYCDKNGCYQQPEATRPPDKFKPL